MGKGGYPEAEDGHDGDRQEGVPMPAEKLFRFLG